MPYQICPMRKEDCRQVTEIDREAFPTMWPPPNYQHELKNVLARYLVASDGAAPAPPEKKAAARRTGLLGFLSRIMKSSLPEPSSGNGPSEQFIAGFAGFWILYDEAHVTSIAVRKSHMRRGIGELLLISLIELAAKLKARIVTLEVRASNEQAQSLYQKYGFKAAGLRRAYYTDNREDAIIMSTDDINSAPFQEQFQHLKQVYSRKRGASLQSSDQSPLADAGPARQGTG